MLDTDAAVNRELQRLRKLPENRVCPNCLKEDRIGFKSICVTFQTFVCNECKSAHQSFSHRVKSVDMSVWKLEEVQALDRQNGGGNRMAQKRWLATLPEASRPIPESSTLDQYKKFIQEAYIDQRWAAATAPDVGEAREDDQAERDEDRRKGRRRHGGLEDVRMNDAAVAPTRVRGKHRRRDKSGHGSPAQPPQQPEAFPANEMHQAYPDVMWPDGLSFPSEGADKMSTESRFELDWRSTNPGDASGGSAAPGSDAASSPFWSPSPSHHSLPANGPQSFSGSLYHSPISSVAVPTGRQCDDAWQLSNPWTPPIDATNPWADALLKHALLVSGRA